MSVPIFQPMNERRYSEDEVSAIFERAAEAQQAVRRTLSPGEGLTLTDLQAIGREVGIPAELVDLAARSVDQQGRDESRTLLGLPVGVGRTVDLGRRLTDDAWERLVVDLRETFDARGAMRSDGSLRQWTNGNLQALLEPTPTGHVAEALAGTGSLMGFGAALFALGAARLPGWARTRRRQMEGVAARLALATEGPVRNELVAGEEVEPTATHGDAIGQVQVDPEP
jgi:hypothetical protein